MDNYKLQEIDKNTLLLLPIDYQIPLSIIIEDFNKINKKQTGTVLMDLFIYVGNKKIDISYLELKMVKYI